MADIKINIFLVSRSLKRLQQSAYAPIRKKTGLGQMDLQIIFTLSHFPVAATVGSVHKHTGFNKGQISVCLAGLLKKGYLEKIDDKRNPFDLFVLSEKGKEIADNISRNTAYGRKKLLKGFTQEEAKKAKEYLERILQNAKDLDGKIKFE